MERSFWRCNSAQPMQAGRGEGTRTLLHTQRCSDPELLSCLPTAPIHTEPRCFIQQTAPHPLRTPPPPLGNPMMPPSSLRTPGHIKSTWDLELPAASQHPVCEHEPFWTVASRDIHPCLRSLLLQGTGTETCIGCSIKPKKPKVFVIMSSPLPSAHPHVQGCAALGPPFAVTSDAVTVEQHRLNDVLCLRAAMRLQKNHFPVCSSSTEIGTQTERECPQRHPHRSGQPAPRSRGPPTPGDTRSCTPPTHRLYPGGYHGAEGPLPVHPLCLNYSFALSRNTNQLLESIRRPV